MSEHLLANIAADVDDGAMWDTQATMGWRINGDGTTTAGFGIIVRTKKRGASRWVKRTTIWQRTPEQPAAEMMAALREAIEVAR